QDRAAVAVEEAWPAVREARRPRAAEPTARRFESSPFPSRILRARRGAIPDKATIRGRCSCLSLLRDSPCRVLGDEEGFHQRRDASRMLHVRRVPCALPPLDPRLGKPGGNPLGIRERPEPILISPDQERRRLDPMNAFPESLVGNGPDEFPRGPH